MCKYMQYYEVCVPLKLTNNLVYRTEKILALGVRVIVSVGRTLHTGVVYKKTNSIDPKIRYKSILEIVDNTPVLSHVMLDLAGWMSVYYKTSLGIVIDTMLPLALKHQIIQKVKIRKYEFETELSKTERLIVDKLSSFCPTSGLDSTQNEWCDLNVIRSEICALDFFYSIEMLERKEIIEVYRTFDEKIKPKYANFLRIENSERMNAFPTGDSNLGELTEKQKQAIALLSSYQEEIPLSEVSDKISYAVLRSLKKKNIIDIYPKKIDIDLFTYPDIQPSDLIQLNTEQSSALKSISTNLDEGCFKTFLLFGITGSGKTEVYIEAIKHCRRIGKTALILVPEISLTPQTVYRFYKSFGKNIAVLHSKLSDRQRYLQWKLILEDKISIVIGARSAIFAPLKNLGIIIVDEEHESSYKQDNQPCYNARDIAVKRAEIQQCLVILGSATPSLESWHNALHRKYQLLSLPKRAGCAILPDINIVDMSLNKENSLFSALLLEKINERLSNQEQVIIFHNRRGYANYLQCVNCGKIFKCQACDISFNYHKADDILLCHYCGLQMPSPRKCTDCGSFKLEYGAAGTEQIHSQLKLLFPESKILRMDSDTTRRKSSIDDMYVAMKNKHIDILLGTQMIAKGLDFENVTLVGVIMADVTMNIPDFRSLERTFQLLTQVAGRAGRGKKRGEVIIQTRMPNNYALLSATEHDFLGFAKKELAARTEVSYPPIFRIARVLFTSADLQLLKDTLISNQLLLNKIKNQLDTENLIVMPFIQAPINKINNMFRYHFIIKANKVAFIQMFLDLFIEEFKCPRNIKMNIDVDPVSLM